jgi:hypothetical protein
MAGLTGPGVTFIPDIAGIARLQMTPQMAAALAYYADQIIDAAKGFAPVLTGSYVSGLQVDIAFENGQAVARANAWDFKSHWIEFGTGEPGPTPAFAPLQRGADAAGIGIGGTYDG